RCAFTPGSRGVVWSFDGKQWAADDAMGDDLRARKVATATFAGNPGTRLRDVDADGRCELIAGGDDAPVYALQPDGKTWQPLPFKLPDGLRLVEKTGGDAGVRFVDVNEDGFDDIIVSDGQRGGIYLFTSKEQGWGKNLAAAGPSLPPIVGDG